MYITVKELANAINTKQHIKTGDIIRIITVMIIDNREIHYQVLDNVGNFEYYNEDSVPVSVVKLMNYNKPVKAWKRENKQFFQYRF